MRSRWWAEKRVGTGSFAVHTVTAGSITLGSGSAPERGSEQPLALCKGPADGLSQAEQGEPACVIFQSDDVDVDGPCLDPPARRMCSLPRAVGSGSTCSDRDGLAAPRISPGIYVFL